jgi:hypothetical protein
VAPEPWPPAAQARRWVHFFLLPACPSSHMPSQSPAPWPTPTHPHTAPEKPHRLPLTTPLRLPPHPALQGYWTNNGFCQWPRDNLTVGTVFYTKAQLVNIIDFATGNGPTAQVRAGRGVSMCGRWRLREAGGRQGLSVCESYSARLPAGPITDTVANGSVSCA